MKLGIGMVHQHFMLVASLSVLHNIVLGNPMRDRIYINHKAARKKIQEIMCRYDLAIDLDAKVYQLSVGEKTARGNFKSVDQRRQDFDSR